MFLARLSLVAAILTVPAAAYADDNQGGDIDLNTFHFAMDSRGYLTVNSSQPLGNKEFSFGIVTNYGRNLLKFEGSPDTFIVKNFITPTFHGAVGFKFGPAEVELGVSIPFGVMSADRNPD